MLRRHVFGPGVDEPLLTYEGSDTSNPSWLYADALGSVVGFANASGTSTAATGFDEYGLNKNDGGRFGFTGQAWFPGAIGSDLYHMKARAFSSTLGRFLQPDPILYGGGMNLYAYVGNDPVNLVDPWGLRNLGQGTPCAGTVEPDGSVSWVCATTTPIVTGGQYGVSFERLTPLVVPLLEPAEMAALEQQAPFFEPQQCSRLRQDVIDAQTAIHGAEQFMGMTIAGSGGAVGGELAAAAHEGGAMAVARSLRWTSLAHRTSPCQVWLWADICLWVPISETK